ncbi:DNA damage-regulated autophagy modulator protein 2-like isoform 1 [Aphelenchoides avenae]|nr:DNA damage-regulated autophagy modulator protein 2-like isoform 1 [Aphelenchus avenae]
MNPKLAQPIVSHCRMFLCMCSTFFFISMIVFGPILGRQPDHEHDQAETLAAPHVAHLYRWTGEEPNYLEHVVGTCSEWLLAICFQLYILSFAIELREAYCHAPKLKLIAIYEDGTESSVSEVSGTSGCSPFACCIGGCGPYPPSKTTLSDLESSANIGSDASMPTSTSHQTGTNVSESVLFALDDAEKASVKLPPLRSDSSKADHSVLRVKF